MTLVDTKPKAAPQASTKTPKTPTIFVDGEAGTTGCNQASSSGGYTTGCQNRSKTCREAHGKIFCKTCSQSARQTRREKGCGSPHICTSRERG